MTVRLRTRVFVRHADDESVVVCLRTGGCTVMSGARPFLKAFDYAPHAWDEIVRRIAAKFGCAAEVVVDDAKAILRELVAQGFVDCEGSVDGGCAGRATLPERSADQTDSGRAGRATLPDDAFPLGAFYARHELPADLHLDLTDRCNERCVHCYIPKNGGTFLPTELAVKVLHEFREAEGLTVYVSGGECMMHPDFATILHEARRLGLNIVVLSNLALCDEERIALLKEVDPQFVNVSLYSMEASEHDAITKLPGSWQKTMNAIRALREADVPVRLATPIMRVNKNAVDKLLAFAREVRAHDILDCDIFGRTDHDCTNQSYALTSQEREEVLRTHRDYFSYLFKPRSDAACCPDAKVCDIGEGKICVNAYGDYYPCDGFHGMVLGNAARDSLMSVWHGEKMEKLRALKNRDFPSCVACANRPWCKVCAMRNFNETGDMFKPDAARCAYAATLRKLWEEK
jgi:radical SAM protein with 4Fe4S-binding SPASM domain